jgi:ribonuclease P protein component
MPVTREPLGPARSRLTKVERLRRRPEFQQVFESGVKAHGRYLTIIARTNGLAVARLGVVATRKVGTAVSRNYAKRLIRELFRTHRPGPGVDLAIIARRELLDAPFASLEADYRSALRRVRRS